MAPLWVRRIYLRSLYRRAEPPATITMEAPVEPGHGMQM